jgi:hypothetical protein
MSVVLPVGNAWFRAAALMETSALESFVAVIEEGSVAAALRRLQLTAGAVAQRIRKLEKDLGMRLVIRAGRAVRPTDVGGRPSRGLREPTRIAAVPGLREAAQLQRPQNCCDAEQVSSPSPVRALRLS